MRRSTQWACLTSALGLGLAAVVVTVAGLSAALAAGQPDVTIDLTAPAHVAPQLAVCRQHCLRQYRGRGRA